MEYSEVERYHEHERYKSWKEITMRKALSLVSCIICVLVVLTLVAVAPGYTATKMPPFKLEDVRTGKLVKSSSFKGKSLLVMFFATWCPPCIQEIPNLIDLQNTYEKRNFSVVGISVDQEKGVVEKLIDKKSINYPVMMADKAVTRNFGGVYGIPTAFLVDSKGRIMKKYTGYVAQSVLIKDLKRIIK